MSVELNIVSLFDTHLNSNGDSENVRVLRYRAQLAGISCSSLPSINEAQQLDENTDIVVLGSCSDDSLETVRDLLIDFQGPLRQLITDGVPVLAIGTAMELLSWGIEKSDGSVIEGLGIFPGRAVPREHRVVDELVFDSVFGKMIGFENHARDFVGAEQSVLGAVRYGSGNGSAQRRDTSSTQVGQKNFEGVRMGTAFGTHAHGPVCAINPRFTDYLLTVACSRKSLEYRTQIAHQELDFLTRTVRNRMLRSHELAEE